MKAAGAEGKGEVVTGHLCTAASWQENGEQGCVR
jgi:hypothetical protein